MGDTLQRNAIRFLSSYFHLGTFSRPLLKHEERFSFLCQIAKRYARDAPLKCRRAEVASGKRGKIEADKRW